MKKLSWVNFALGVWLTAAPFALAYRGIQAALWDDVIVGVLIALYSLLRAMETERITVDRWIVAILGLWALVSPFLLHFSGTTTAVWNNVIVGAMVVIIAIWLAVNPHKQAP